MAIRNITFGGVTEWANGEKVTSTDLNDTFTAVKTKKDTVLGTTGVNGTLSMPLGSILAWAGDMTGVPALPAGWVQCNGQVISDATSPFNGVTLPNLNSTGYYLMSSTTSGSTGGAASHTHTIAGGGRGNTYGSSGPTQPAAGSTTGAAANDPPYYAVIWIMRIK